MINKKAVWYLCLSAACFTILNTLIKYVEHFPTFQIVFFRSLLSSFLAISYLRIKGIPILGNNKPILIARAITGLSSMSLFFWAIKLMPLGSAVALRYLAPFFTALLAVWFLKEKMKPIQWLFFLTAFGGVVLLKGFDSRISLFALSVILLAALLSGVVYFIIRKIGESEHPVVVVNYFMTFSLVIGAIVCLFHWETPTHQEWLILLSFGIFGYFAQLFMTKGMQIEEANKIVPFKYVEVIFTLLASWIWLGEHQTIMALVGITIIIVSLLANLAVKDKKVVS